MFRPFLKTAINKTFKSTCRIRANNILHNSLRSITTTNRNHERLKRSKKLKKSKKKNINNSTKKSVIIPDEDIISVKSDDHIASDIKFDVNDPDKLFEVVNRVRQVIGSESIEYPNIVGVGDQSTGKSSFLRYLLGIDEDIFYTGDGMASKRPFIITTIRDVNARPYFQFGSNGTGPKYYNLKKVKEIIARENTKEITHVPLELTRVSPNVQNMTFIDTMGNISSSKDGMKIVNAVYNMNMPYIKDSNNIKVFMMAGNKDREHSKTLGMIQEANQWANTVVVLSKIDLIHPPSEIPKIFDDAQTYTNGRYPYGVILNMPEYNGVSNSAMKKHAEDYYEKSGLSKNTKLKLGVDLLIRDLSKIQQEKSIVHLPKYISAIDEEIEKRQNNLSLLQKLSDLENLDALSSELSGIFDSLSTYSPDRLLLQETVRNEINKYAQDIVEQTFNQKFELIQNHSYQEDLCVANKQMTSAFGNRTFNNHIRTNRKNIGVTVNDIIDDNGYGNFLNIGPCMPGIDTEDLDDYSQDAWAKTSASSFIRYFQNDKTMQHRKRWYKKLENVINSVVFEQNIAEKSCDICIENIINFTQELIRDPIREKSEEDIELASTFVNYLVSKIAEKSSEFDLEGSIKQMLLREINPTANLSEKNSYVVNLTKPHIDTYKHMWEDDMLYYIETYSDLDSASYREVLKRRIAEDIYRIVSPNLLREILRDCVNFSLSFFRDGNADDEREETVTIVKQLKNDRLYLTQALNHHGK